MPWPSRNSRRACMSEEAGRISLRSKSKKAGPGTFSPSGRMTLERLTRRLSRSTPSKHHIGVPSTSTTCGTRSAYLAGARLVQRSAGSVMCESTSMTCRPRMSMGSSLVGAGSADAVEEGLGEHVRDLASREWPLGAEPPVGPVGHADERLREHVVGRIAAEDTSCDALVENRTDRALITTRQGLDLERPRVVARGRDLVHVLLEEHE